MKTTCMKAFICAAMVIIAVPQLSFAYKTTSQSARQYSDTTALYTITYRFGFLNRELYIPISAVRGAMPTRDAVSYELMTGSTTSNLGTMSALVVSTAEIKNGMYYLPAGKAADFTFVVALTMPARTKVADYKTQMTALPFIMVDKGKKINAQLNPSELQYYVTPTAGMNAKLFSNDMVKVTGITYTLKAKE